MPTFFGRRYMRQELTSSREIYVGIFVLLLTGGICTALVLHSQAEGQPLFEISQDYLLRGQAQQLAAAALPEMGRAAWSEPRDIRTFSPDTLYEKINGRADLYLQYHFKQLTFAKYFKDNDPDQDIEVWLYDMSAPANAQGIFKAEQPEDFEAVDVGQDGYRSGASIFFWKGSLYVYAITLDPGQADDCLHLAGKLAETIEASGGLQWTEVVFPRENIVEDSFAYLATNAFSLDFLNEVYTAGYAMAGGRATLFVHQAVDEATAEQRLDQYVAVFKDYGEIISQQDGLVVGESAGVIDAVFRHGRYLAGVSEAPNAPLAERLAQAFRSHLHRLQDQLP